MDLVKEVSRAIKNMGLLEKKSFILGVSGGIDSIVLLDIFSRLFKKNQVIVAHLNHGLRSEAELDKLLVKSLAKQYGMKFVSKNDSRIRDRKGNLEENARNARYSFLFSVAKKYRTDIVVTAHHADDNIETVTMNSYRGAFLEGLTGISRLSNVKYLNSCFNVARPMLNIFKKDIRDYQVNHHLIFREDKTNNDIKFLRNKFRHTVLNTLSIKKKLEIAEKIKNLKMDYDILKTKINKLYAQSIYKKSNNCLVLKKDFLTRLTSNVLSEIVKAAIFDIKDDLRDISSTNIQSVVGAIINNKSGMEIMLPDGLFVLIDYSLVIFTHIKSKGTVLKKQKLTMGTNTVKNLGIKILVKESAKKNNKLTCLDLSKVNLPIYIDSYRPGMRIKIKNVGTKKVQDIYVDEKVEKRYRRGVPIILDAKGQLIAIMGLVVSDICHSDKKNVKYLLIGIKDINKL